MATVSLGPNAFLISPSASDHEFLQALFLKNGWSLCGATSFESARKQMQKARVVLTEAELRPDTWKDVLALAYALPQPPLLIVISNHADEYLWVEALNLGAHDVIAKPFDQLEVIRVLGAAWSSHGQLPVRRKGVSASNH